MKHRIGCLDNDGDYRMLVRLALADTDDFELVAEGPSNADGLAILEAHQPDVVLFDATGGGHGASCLPGIRRAVPDALPIAMVGFGADDLRGSLAAGGTVGQISKRVRPTQLPDEIKALATMLELVTGALDQSTTELAPELSSGRQARRFVDEAMQRWDCGSLADTVTLLVSELVANAVMHAHSPAEVSVLLHPGCVRIEVADQSPVIPKRQVVDPDMPSGRGLALVEKLSRSWGIDPTPTGKCIWFEVARPDAPERD